MQIRLASGQMFLKENSITSTHGFVHISCVKWFSLQTAFSIFQSVHQRADKTHKTMYLPLRVTSCRWITIYNFGAARDAHDTEVPHNSTFTEPPAQHMAINRRGNQKKSGDVFGFGKYQTPSIQCDLSTIDMKRHKTGCCREVVVLVGLNK